MKNNHADTSHFEKSKKSTLTIPESLFSGCIAGATEVLVNHPLWSIKTRIQRGENWKVGPKILYRGLIPNAASMIPITAVQVGLDQSFQTLAFYNAHTLSHPERLSCAFVAGACSALISCPIEMVMTQQSQDGSSFIKTANSMGFSRLYTGLPATAFRDGFFTLAFIGAIPLVKAQLKPYCTNDLYASILAGIPSGVAATLVTQGVDTLKTHQQASRDPTGFLKSARALYHTAGVQGFFKGTLPRGTRVISAVTLLGIVNDHIKKVLTDAESDDKVIQKNHP